MNKEDIKTGNSSKKRTGAELSIRVGRKKCHLISFQGKQSKPSFRSPSKIQERNQFIHVSNGPFNLNIDSLELSVKFLIKRKEVIFNYYNTFPAITSLCYSKLLPLEIWRLLLNFRIFTRISMNFNKGVIRILYLWILKQIRIFIASSSVSIAQDCESRLLKAISHIIERELKSTVL